MANLFGRTAVANLGGLQLQGFRMQFEATHATASDPNTLELAIWNLNEASRAKLSERDLRMELEAGYVFGTDVVFVGDIDRTWTTREGVDRVTHVEAQDGGAGLRKARVSMAFREGSRLVDSIKSVGREMLVDLGNLDQLQESDFGRRLSQYANGDAVFGPAKNAMDRLCTAAGLEWRVQDGALEVATRGQPFTTQAVVLSSGSGLVGSPEPGEDGNVKARSLIRPGLKPGRKVQIQASTVDGFYRIERVVYRGDTHEGDWVAELEVSPL